MAKFGINWVPALVAWDAFNPHPDLADLPRETVFVTPGNGNPQGRQQTGERNDDPLGRPLRSRDFSDGRVKVPGANESASPLRMSARVRPAASKLFPWFGLGRPNAPEHWLN